MKTIVEYLQSGHIKQVKHNIKQVHSLDDLKPGDYYAHVYDGMIGYGKNMKRGKCRNASMFKKKVDDAAYDLYFSISDLEKTNIINKPIHIQTTIRIWDQNQKIGIEPVTEEEYAMLDAVNQTIDMNKQKDDNRLHLIGEINSKTLEVHIFKDYKYLCK